MRVTPRMIVDAVQAAQQCSGYVECAIVGSALYRDDAQDVDVAVLVDPAMSVHFVRTGWEPGGSKDPNVDGNKWTSYRSGDFNFLVTNDAAFFARMRLASDLCAELELPTKRQRCLVHRVVRDGLSVAEALKDIPT